VAEFADRLCYAADAGHAEAEIGVELVTHEAPEASQCLHVLDDEARILAELPEAVRTIAKLVVRLLVKPERERRR
jgi:hypothetical protein